MQLASNLLLAFFLSGCFTASSMLTPIASAQDVTDKAQLPDASSLDSINNSIELPLPEEPSSLEDDDYLIESFSLGGWIDLSCGSSNMILSPDFQTIAFISKDAIQLWDSEGNQLKTIEGDFCQSTYQVVFSPDSQLIASVGADASLHFWDKKGNMVKLLEAEKDLVYGDVVFGADSQTIAATTLFENRVQLWRQEDGHLQTLGDRGDEHICEVSFSPDNQAILIVRLDGTVRLWNRKGNLLKSLEIEADGFSCPEVLFGANGQLINTTNSSFTDAVGLWDREGNLVKMLEGSGIALSPDSQILALSQRELSPDDGHIIHSVQLLDLEGKLIASIEDTSSVIFSPDNQVILSNNWDSIRLWDKEGNQLKTITRKDLDLAENEGISDVSFGLDGQTIASISSNNIVKFWDREGNLARSLDMLPIPESYSSEDLIFPLFSDELFIPESGKEEELISPEFGN